MVEPLPVGTDLFEDLLEVGGRTVGEIRALLIKPPEGRNTCSLLMDVGFDAGFMVIGASPNKGALRRHDKAFPLVEGHLCSSIIRDQAGAVATLAEISENLSSSSLLRVPRRAPHAGGVGSVSEFH